MTDAVVQTRNLHAGYGHAHILFGVDFEAHARKLTLIVGPNGSGKSTLLKSLFGLSTVYSGTIHASGEEITGMEPHHIARRKIAYLPQVNNVFGNLTVRENLLMASYILDHDTTTERISDAMDSLPVLREKQGAKAMTLSGGQRQMLGMGMALVRKPTIMLFDEPTASLSPKLADDVLHKIGEIRDEYGITCVLVEQNVKRALTMGDHVYLLAGGKNVFDGKPDALLADPELGRMYLGIS